MTRKAADRGRVRVAAAPKASAGYDIIVSAGVLDTIAARVAVAAPASAYAVITPRRLEDSHGARTADALRDAGLRAELFAFDDSETHKTRETWAALTDRMLARQLGRDTCVIAVGGGVTGDLAGFAAATYMRGLPLIQVPTTLLAMIDASVGGKTGVDTPAGKNLVGAFHSPRLVLIDPLVLRTLPPVQLRSGLAEAVKHGAILDAGYFTWIEQNAAALLALDAAALEHLIVRSVQLKAGIVSEDPLEHGRRVILNFGHTVGHALEHCSGYTVPHGFAVAAGMCAEAAIGEVLGITSAGTLAELERVLSRLELPTGLRADPAALVEVMRIDKKARQAEARFAMLQTIGECARDSRGEWTHEAGGDVVERVLRGRATGAEVV